jgi:ABC-type branched-subunit amino acid transport system ATPase component
MQHERVMVACSGAAIPQLMELVELAPLRDLLVGAPGGAGLSVEQRKRLSIAVELVANPSLVLMDEPTTGADCWLSHMPAGACMQCACACKAGEKPGWMLVLLDEPTTG